MCYNSYKKGMHFKMLEFRNPYVGIIKGVIDRLIKLLLTNILFCRTQVPKVFIPLRILLKQNNPGNKRFINPINLTVDSVNYFSLLAEMDL